MLKQLWQKLSTTILGGAIVIGFTGVASRILGLVRDRMLASTFGGGGALDPYFAAFKLPDFVFNVLVLGALSSSFIPVFVSYLKRAEKNPELKDEAWCVANSILNLLLIVLIGLGILFFIFADFLVPLIAPGFSGEKLQTTIQLSRIMLVAIVFFGASNIVSAILNSFKRFMAFALAPVLYNLGIIAGIVFFVPRWGITGLAYGVVLGAGAHLLIQVPSVLRLGFRYMRILKWRHPGVKEVGRLMLPRTFGLAVNQIDQLVSTIIASSLAAGSLTQLNFANNLQNFPINVFGVSLAIAVFPVFSEAFASQNLPAFKAHFSKTIRRLLVVMIPTSVLLLVLRAQIVRVVVGARAFDWNATYLTAQILGFFTLSIFAQALIPILARSFYALKDTATPVKVGILAVIVDIALAVYLAPRLGIIGVALAFSISSLVNMSFLYYLLRRRLGDLDDAHIARSCVKIVIASLFAGVSAWAALRFAALGVDMRTLVGIFLQGLTAGIFGILVFLITASLFKVEEMEIFRDWWRKFKDFFRNGRSPNSSG
ncbi:murein biosynthesis integral membrane protein MurJ [Candidatus Parcubacteria bacterium]|jgi:putative peptidoglycan lipid II flippase|nr:MAG: murein biosynthesis integral membrane protein MurJ [Candidatus Parcubacteria bacterium]